MFYFSEPQERIRAPGRYGSSRSNVGMQRLETRVVDHGPRIKIDLRDLLSALETAGRYHFDKVGLFEKNIVNAPADDAQKNDPRKEHEDTARTPFFLNDDCHSFDKFLIDLITLISNQIPISNI